MARGFSIKVVEDLLMQGSFDEGSFSEVIHDERAHITHDTVIVTR
jgi:hypothetical protein